MISQLISQLTFSSFFSLENINLAEVSITSPQTQDATDELNRFVDNQVHFDIYSSHSSEEDDEREELDKLKNVQTKVNETNDEYLDQDIATKEEEFNDKDKINREEDSSSEKVVGVSEAASDSLLESSKDNQSKDFSQADLQKGKT